MKKEALDTTACIEIAGFVINQRSVLLIKVGAKLKVKCFLVHYFSYTQTVLPATLKDDHKGINLQTKI